MSECFHRHIRITLALLFTMEGCCRMCVSCVDNVAEQIYRWNFWNAAWTICSNLSFGFTESIIFHMITNKYILCIHSLWPSANGGKIRPKREANCDWTGDSGQTHTSPISASGPRGHSRNRELRGIAQVQVITIKQSLKKRLCFHPVLLNS